MATNASIPARKQHQTDAESDINTEITARYMYEKGGDSLASLRAYQRIWDSSHSGSTNKSKKRRGDSDIMTEEQTISRAHNHVVLSNLSCIFNADEDGKRHDSENLTNELSGLHQRQLNELVKTEEKVPSSSTKPGKKGQAERLAQQNRVEVTLATNIQKSIEIESNLIENSDHLNFLQYPKGQGSGSILPLMIMRHNLALALLSSGRPLEGKNILIPIFRAFILNSKSDETDDVNDVACRISFLLLDCIINYYRGDSNGLSDHVAGSQDEEDEESKLPYVSVNTILSWIESYIDNQSNNLDSESNNLKEGYVNELKFRFHLYKARVVFLQQIKQEAKARKSKKELKSALEIFNHKLRAGASGVEESTGSVGSISDVHNEAHIDEPQQTLIQTSIGPQLNKLDVQSQCALYLKANLENIKSNAKKSLKLCAQAKLAGERNREQVDQTPFTEKELNVQQNLDEAMHFNNLGILHQSVGKIHIAMHYYAKALSLIFKIEDVNGNKVRNESNTYFATDGVSRSIPVAETLHNAAICAIQAKKWINAYECMAKCVQASPHLFALRARCWLRMAECCIGIHTQRRNSEGGDCDFSVRGNSTKGISARIVFEKSKNQQSYNFKDINGRVFQLSHELGSLEDLNQVSMHPLPRALFCLRTAFRLCLSNDPNPSDTSEETLEATRLSLAYVMLELNDPSSAYQFAKAIVQNPASNIKDNEIAKRLSLRRRATAKMYACEALCSVGDSEGALKILTGSDDSSEGTNESTDDQKSAPIIPDGCLDQLARDLAMVPLNSSETSTNDKISLPLAQKMQQKWLKDATSSMQVTMSGVMASKNEMEMAEKYAVMALKSCHTKRINVPGNDFDQGALARKALLYCLLRRGNTDGALAILRSTH